MAEIFYGIIPEDGIKTASPGLPLSSIWIGTADGRATSMQNGAGGGVARALYDVSRKTNFATAVNALNNKMSELMPEIASRMPVKYGGVLVVATLMKLGPGLSFSSAFVYKAAPSVDSAISDYRNQGSIKAKGSVTWFVWAQVKRPPRVQQNGPVIEAWY